MVPVFINMTWHSICHKLNASLIDIAYIGHELSCSYNIAAHCSEHQEGPLKLMKPTWSSWVRVIYLCTYNISHTRDAVEKPDAECVMTEVYSHYVHHKLTSTFYNSFDVSHYITDCTTGA